MFDAFFDKINSYLPKPATSDKMPKHVKESINQTKPPKKSKDVKQEENSKGSFVTITK